MFLAGRKEGRSSTTRRPSRWSRSRREKLSVSVSQDNRPGQQAPVSEPAGRRSYKVEVDGVVYRRNRRQLIRTSEPKPSAPATLEPEPESNPEKAPTTVPVPVSQQGAEPTPQAEAMKLPVEAPRRSERVRKQPAWMKDYSTCN